MSSPAARDTVEPCRTPSDIDPALGLMVGVADHLVPLFATVGIGIPLARRMALSAIEAYEPRTRADYVNVARTIAFSMSALALLGKAAAPDMSMAEKMRAFGRANALNRSADQSERTMMQRRHHQQTTVRAGDASSAHPAPRRSEPEPDLVLDDDQVDAAVAEAMAVALGQARATAMSNSASHPTAPARPTEASEIAAPPPEHPATMTRTAAAAIHGNSPTTDGGHLQIAPHHLRYQQRVSGHNATPQATGQSVTPHPG